MNDDGEILEVNFGSGQGPNRVPLSKCIPCTVGQGRSVRAEEAPPSPPLPTWRSWGVPRSYFSDPPPSTDHVDPASTFGGVNLDDLPLPDLQARKREIKQRIKQYNINFANIHGRMPVKEEKEPIRHLYDSYNTIKDRIVCITLSQPTTPSRRSSSDRGSLAHSSAGLVIDDSAASDASSCDEAPMDSREPLRSFRRDATYPSRAPASPSATEPSLTANPLTATDATAWRRCSRHPIQWNKATCNESQHAGSNAPTSGDNVCINDKFNRALWTLRYGELIEYKEKHGDCNVPETYEQNQKLGTWVQYQRQQYRHLQEGKYSTMTEGRIEKLEELGFIWRKANSSSWNQKYDELKKYKQKHGDCNVSKHNKSYKPLGTWVSNQRTQYRLLQQGVNSQMTEDRITKLKKIGFVWDASSLSANQPNNDTWNQRYKELMEYKQEHGNCDVPQQYNANKQLRMWVNNQRHQCRLLEQGIKTSMTEEKLDKLKEIGFTWASDFFSRAQIKCKGSI